MNWSAINYFRCGKQGHYQFECLGLEKEDLNYVEFDEDEELVLMAYTKKSKVEREDIWFLDFGCSNHITGDKTVGFYVLKLIVCKQKRILFSIKLLLKFIQ